MQRRVLRAADDEERLTAAIIELATIYGRCGWRRIASRDPDRQTAEIHTRIALMNRFPALGTAEIVRVA